MNLLNLKYFSTIILIAPFLTSCAIFDSYKDNKDSWYHASLTKTDKEKIKLENTISKNWVGKNSNGDYTIGKLNVVKTNKNNHYEFIEIGIWREKHSASASKGWKATIKDSTVYDVMGNILFKEKFIDEINDDKGPYLIEKWTSSLTDSLRQTVIYFYPNGQIKLKENFTVIDHKYLARDSNKEKQITQLESYLENGQKCFIDELIFDEWYQPGTWMKK